ncbi:MAG: HIT family protein, partial [Pseudomonadota bacterium]
VDPDVHFHVIPRYEGVPLGKHGSGMEKDSVLAANAEALKGAL